jgi:hypothetical protein
VGVDMIRQVLSTGKDERQNEEEAPAGSGYRPDVHMLRTACAMVQDMCAAPEDYFLREKTSHPSLQT